MIFRTKDGVLLNIVRSSFDNDVDYYSYIKKSVVGMTKNTEKKDNIVDVIVSLVKK